MSLHVILMCSQVNIQLSFSPNLNLQKRSSNNRASVRKQVFSFFLHFLVMVLCPEIVSLMSLYPEGATFRSLLDATI